MSNFFLFPGMLQSAQRHSAIVLPDTTNGMQELHPVMYLLFKVLSQLIVDDLWNFCTVLIKTQLLCLQGDTA